MNPADVAVFPALSVRTSWAVSPAEPFSNKEHLAMAKLRTGRQVRVPVEGVSLNPSEDNFQCVPGYVVHAM